MRIWSCFATIPSSLDEQVVAKRTVGRLATYLQGYGDLLVRTNGWDPGALARLRADELFATFPGAIDQAATPEQLEHLRGLIPAEWLAPAATGSDAACAAAVRAQLDLGVDGVILHGSAPDELAGVVAAYRRDRDAARFAGLDANPGRARRT